ncbi:hypothetical protein BDW74DRAFT_183965 [Aspergillus multicolor]|uniref:uncharacterized protein n=1 Tax=Aspergillus multicolor TaxID=41759 RepID=UPI003CCDA64D
MKDLAYTIPKPDTAGFLQPDISEPALKWVLISWVFENKLAFRQATAHLLHYSYGEIESSGLPIPDFVIGASNPFFSLKAQDPVFMSNGFPFAARLNKARNNSISRLINDLESLHTHVAKGSINLQLGQKTQPGNSVEMCTYAVLGALTKHMMDSQIHQIPLASPFKNIAYKTLVAGCATWSSPDMSQVKDTPFSERARITWSSLEMDQSSMLHHEACSLQSRVAAVLKKHLDPWGLELDDKEFVNPGREIQLIMLSSLKSDACCHLVAGPLTFLIATGTHRCRPVVQACSSLAQAAERSRRSVQCNQTMTREQDTIEKRDGFPPSSRFPPLHHRSPMFLNASTRAFVQPGMKPSYERFTPAFVRLNTWVEGSPNGRAEAPAAHHTIANPIIQHILPGSVDVFSLYPTSDIIIVLHDTCRHLPLSLRELTSKSLSGEQDGALAAGDDKEPTEHRIRCYSNHLILANELNAGRERSVKLLSNALRGLPLSLANDANVNTHYGDGHARIHPNLLSALGALTAHLSSTGLLNPNLKPPYHNIGYNWALRELVKRARRFCSPAHVPALGWCLSARVTGLSKKLPRPAGLDTDDPKFARHVAYRASDTAGN